MIAVVFPGQYILQSWPGDVEMSLNPDLYLWLEDRLGRGMIASPAMLKEPRYLKKVFKHVNWAWTYAFNENLQPYRGHVLFKKSFEQEAMLFKLTWGGL